MRPIFLIAALLALTPAASGAAEKDGIIAANPAPEVVIVSPINGIDEEQVIDPFGARVHCPDTPMSLARKKTERPQLRYLDELPPAEAFAAVDRRVDNCPAPMYLSETKGR